MMYRIGLGNESRFFPETFTSTPPLDLTTVKSNKKSNIMISKPFKRTDSYI